MPLVPELRPNGCWMPKTTSADFSRAFPTIRAAKLKGYMEEIDLLRLERQTKLRPGLATGDTPIERDYAEAMRFASSDPDRAAARLRAIIDFYGQSPAASETTSRFLELSRRQLAHLDQQIAKQSPAYLKLIDENLSRADQLRTTDPDQSPRNLDQHHRALRRQTLGRRPRRKGPSWIERSAELSGGGARDGGAGRGTRAARLEPNRVLRFQSSLAASHSFFVPSPLLPRPLAPG